MLEDKLEDSIKDNAPDSDRFKIIQWVCDGAGEVFNENYLVCHSTESEMRLPDFSVFETIKE